jgi:hypothetical protein
MDRTMYGWLAEVRAGRGRGIAIPQYFPSPFTSWRVENGAAA